MKAIVTGGLGFIGSHVVDHLLHDGFEVLVLDNFFSGRDRWEGTAIRPDIRGVDIRAREQVQEAFRSFKPEVVFHMAAHHYIPYCEANPIEAYDLNVTGTLNVLAAGFESGIQRLFFASTADVYAPSPRAHREDDAIGPFTTYGRTKLIGEQLCRDALNWGRQTNVLVGRIFNAVGKRETNPHLVPEVVKQIARGVSELRLGNLFPTRDFVDVDTQARAIVDATLRVEGIETCNIGSGVAISVREMVDIAIDAAGRPVTVGTDPAKMRAAERNNLCADVSRLRTLIGFAPRPAGKDSICAILAEETSQLQLS